MKTILVICMLALTAGNAIAGPAELSNAKVTDMSAENDPARAVTKGGDQWLAFSIPALESTRSPCCWRGRWNGIGEAGCSLERKHQSYGMRSDAPLTDHLVVFAEIKDRQVSEVRVVGKRCPVDAGGAGVTWIGTVDEKTGLDWLEQVARSDADDAAAGSALQALALHRSDAAGDRLYDLATEPRGGRTTEAIFWLGEARGEQGFELLGNLLETLPPGGSRREINFALAQNASPAAAGLLYKIGRSDPDPEQRGGALFWLAEEYPTQARGWLLEVIENERDPQVLEQAVFAISQLPDEDSGPLLLALARNDRAPREVRRQALFWLANSDNDETVEALTRLLIR